MVAALGFVGVAVAARLLERRRALSAFSILLVAGVLRLLVLPINPGLSDDVYRYIWDGRVVAAGLNPYLLAPEDPALESSRDDLWQDLSHRDVATVYPPLAQVFFAAISLVPAPLWWWKALLAGVDLLSCYWLMRLLIRRKLPVGWSVWYAWNPLVTLEIAAMGHVDGLGVAAVLLTTLLLSMRRPWQAGSFAAATAVLIKFVPILALPVWARQSSRPVRFLGLSLGLVFAAVVPILWSVGGAPPGLVEYGVSWEFNGPLFEPLWRTLEQLDVPRHVSRILDRVKQRSGEHEFWNRFYPFNYPQFLAKVILAVGFSLALVWSWSRRDVAVALRTVFGAIVVFSATVYPWYLLWVLPWAVVTYSRPWLLLSTLVPLSYLPQFTELNLFPWIHGMIWIPFAGAMFLWRRRPSH